MKTECFSCKKEVETNDGEIEHCSNRGATYINVGCNNCGATLGMQLPFRYAAVDKICFCNNCGRHMVGVQRSKNGERNGTNLVCTTCDIVIDMETKEVINEN